MLTVKRIKELIKGEEITDEVAEEIRDQFRYLVEEIIFEKWLEALPKKPNAP